MGEILWNSLALFENSGLTAEKNSSFYFVEFLKNSATCKDKFVRLPSFSKSRQKSNSTFLKTRQKNSSFAPYGSVLIDTHNNNNNKNDRQSRAEQSRNDNNLTLLHHVIYDIEELVEVVEVIIFIMSQVWNHKVILKSVTLRKCSLR